MGEAKRRGTREERVAQAIERDKKEQRVRQEIRNRRGKSKAMDHNKLAILAHAFAHQKHGIK